MTRLLSLFLFCAASTIANTSQASLDMCGFEFASVEEWIWPVFLHDPGEAGEMQIPSVDILINREGSPISLIRTNNFPDDEFNYLRNIIPEMVFNPGNSCEEPIESYARCDFDEFFVQKEPSPDTPDLVPPFPKWRITKELVHQLEYYGMTYEESFAIVDFFIDKEGNLKRTEGRNRYGKTLSKRFFKSNRKSIKFRPATVGGIPVKSKIRLYFGEDKVISQETEYIDNAREPCQALRPWPENIPLTELFTVTAELIVDQDGDVMEIRFLSQMPSAISMQLMKDLRFWRLDTSEFNLKKDEQSFMVKLAYSPEDRSPALLELSLIRKDMKLPKLIKRGLPTYPRKQLEAGNSGIAIIKFVVTTSGKVGQTEVVFSSHPDFGKATESAIKDCIFEPATFNGKKVNCWFRTSIPFKIE